MVLYDNLVRGVPREEALSVVAHELSHARHDDVLHGSLLGAAGAVAGIGLLGLVLGRRRRGGQEAEMQNTAGDPAVVPRVLALVAVAGLLASPVQNAISRKVETRADVEAVIATGDPEAFVELQRQLAARSLADLTSPGWSHFWFGSHPTTRERIAVAGWLSDRAVRALAVPAHVLVDRVAGVLEQVGEDALAEQEHCGNDDGGDAGNQQAVLDGRSAALVAPAQQPGASTAPAGAEWGVGRPWWLL